MSTSQCLPEPHDVKTAPVVAAGLIGGYASARLTKIRPLGAVALGAAGVYAGRTWLAKHGAGTTAALSVIYLGAFGGAHPLAKKIGAWPAVLSVTAVATGAAWALADRERG